MEQKWLLLQMRPRVIHRIPGRLRIHVPALKKVQPEYNDIVDSIFTKSHLPDGIEQTKINFITGNILVKYDLNEISEKNSLNWIFDIKKIAEDIFLKFLNLNDEEIIITKNKLLEYFKHVANNGTIISKGFTIPHEVWN